MANLTSERLAAMRLYADRADEATDAWRGSVTLSTAEFRALLDMANLQDSNAKETNMKYLVYESEYPEEGTVIEAADKEEARRIYQDETGVHFNQDADLQAHFETVEDYLFVVDYDPAKHGSGE